MGSRKRSRPNLKAHLVVGYLCLFFIVMHWRWISVLLADEQDSLELSIATNDRASSSIPVDDNNRTGTEIDRQKTIPPPPPASLRFDWTNIPVKSPIAKQLQAHQLNCSLPVLNYTWRSYGVGMGSDLHAWGNALWAGLNDGHRIVSPTPWLWISKDDCNNSSLFECYFPQAEPSCGPNDVIKGGPIRAAPCGKRTHWKYNYTIPEYRAAATEYVFSSVSRVVVEEAQRQRHSLFGNDATPPNLITVHVRWGDNNLEVRRKNTPIQAYVDAIERMIRDNGLTTNIHILLCTEDPVAVQASYDATSSKNWTIHVDPFMNRYLPFRKDREIKYNLASHISTETNGRTGLWTLASLLVSMEANYYVLTTKSNWSRLMNELRKNMVDPSCAGCTRIIDIDPGEC